LPTTGEEERSRIELAAWEEKRGEEEMRGNIG
jgi:hypothetical protein